MIVTYMNTYLIVFYMSIHFNLDFLFPIFALIVYLTLFSVSLDIYKYYGHFLISTVFANFLSFLNLIYSLKCLCFLLFTEIQ